jgi:hypothetical protein
VTVDGWQLLGIGPGATQAEIKRAYAAAIRRHRPETHPEEFSAIREAYEAALRWHVPRAVFPGPLLKEETPLFGIGFGLQLAIRAPEEIPVPVAAREPGDPDDATDEEERELKPRADRDRQAKPEPGAAPDAPVPPSRRPSDRISDPAPPSAPHPAPDLAPEPPVREPPQPPRRTPIDPDEAGDPRATTAPQDPLRKLQSGADSAILDGIGELLKVFALGEDAQGAALFREQMKQLSEATIDTRLRYEAFLLGALLNSPAPPLLLVFLADAEFGWDAQMLELGRRLGGAVARRVALLNTLADQYVLGRYLTRNPWIKMLFGQSGPRWFAWIWQWQTALLAQARWKRDCGPFASPALLGLLAPIQMRPWTLYSTDVFLGVLAGLLIGLIQERALPAFLFAVVTALALLLWRMLGGTRPGRWTLQLFVKRRYLVLVWLIGCGFLGTTVAGSALGLEWLAVGLTGLAILPVSVFVALAAYGLGMRLERALTRPLVYLARITEHELLQKQKKRPWPALQNPPVPEDAVMLAQVILMKPLWIRLDRLARSTRDRGWRLANFDPSSRPGLGDFLFALPASFVADGWPGRRKPKKQGISRPRMIATLVTGIVLTAALLVGLVLMFLFASIEGWLVLFLFGVVLLGGIQKMKR